MEYSAFSQLGILLCDQVISIYAHFIIINLHFLLLLYDMITFRYQYVFILFSLFKIYNFVFPCVLRVVNRCDREWPKTNGRVQKYR